MSRYEDRPEDGASPLRHSSDSQMATQPTQERYLSRAAEALALEMPNSGYDNAQVFLARGSGSRPDAGAWTAEDQDRRNAPDMGLELKNYDEEVPAGQEQVKRTKPLLSRARAAWKRLPSILRAVLPAIFWAAIIMAPSAVILSLWTAPRDTYPLTQNRVDAEGGLKLTWQMEVTRWSLLGTASLAVYLIGGNFISRISFLISVVIQAWFWPLSESASIRVNTFNAISPELGGVLTTAVMMILSDVFLVGPLLRTPDPNLWIWLIARTPTGLLILAIGLTLEKFAILEVSANFQSVAYGQRIKDSNRALEILDLLSEAAAWHVAKVRWGRQRHRKGNDRSLEAPRKRGSGVSSLATLTNLTLASALKALTTEDDQLFAEGRTDESAKWVSHQIYWFLVDDPRRNISEDQKASVSNYAPERQELKVSDFQRVFKKDADAREAFMLFDSNCDNTVCFEELRRGVLAFYEERRALVRNITELGNIVGRLHRILLVAVFIIVVVLAFLVYDVNFVTYLASLGTVALSLSFIFGGSAATTFECIIFLFVMHPYDIGDRVFIDGHNMVVCEINILTTVFDRFDGQRIIMTNSRLLRADILNVRRSGPQLEIIFFDMSSSTPVSLIAKLEEGMTEFLADNPQLFGKAEKGQNVISFGGYDTEDGAKLTLRLELQHPTNWQDEDLRWERRKVALRQLKILMTELGVEYLPPIHRLKHVNRPDLA